MLRSSLITATSVILCASAAAQQNAGEGNLHKAGAVKNGGIYHVATGTWTRNVSGTANLGPDVIYTNTAPGGYFTTLDLANSAGDVQLIDEGRVPAAGGNIATADRTSYTVNCVAFSYCTEVATPNVSMDFTIYDSYTPCGLPSTGGPELVTAGTAAATGLPGGGAPGAGVCWIITLDLTGGEFCLEGDGGSFAPGFNNDVNLDSFGMQLQFTGNFGTNTGPFLAGDPDWTEADPGSITGVGGSGTYYYTGAPSCADTGLDTQDFVAADGMTSLPGGVGCYFFGGYKNTNGCNATTNIPFASFDVTVFADAGECVDMGGPVTFCDPANTNSSGNAATLAVTTGAPSAGQTGVRLDCSGGPNTFASAFGFFLVSDGASINVPLGDGNLCLDGPQGRYNPAAGGARNSLGQFDSNGEFANLAGTSTTGFGFDVPVALPSPPGGDIMGGSTWHFQLWYRDVMGTVNLSNGVSIDF